GGSASSSLKVGLSGSAAFSITSDTCRSLGPRKSCTVVVKFAPSGRGPVDATLTATGKKPSAAAGDLLTGTEGPITPHLYWSNYDAGAAGGGTIVEANLDGSDPKTIAIGQSGPLGIAIEGDHLYWTTFPAPVGAPGSIVEANLDGSDPKTIAAGQSGPVGL